MGEANDDTSNGAPPSGRVASAASSSKPPASSASAHSSRSSRWVVLKFGGTSVSSLERWETIEHVLRQRMDEGLRPLVVCSALSQVSNQLERLLVDAVRDWDAVAPALGKLRETHRTLAHDMELDADDLLADLFEELERTLLGISLTREVTPRLRARVMAQGELMSTRLGAARLGRRGLATGWQDVRELLEARPERRTAFGEERQYLAATCLDGPDPAVEERLRGIDADVLVTQGFMARGPDGDTVLLGRGGSDTSAAYLAARLSAERLEIWTDVPGLFTANPGQVPEARLLRRLGYAEASELASRGAKVLHPRCLAPVRKQEIPLHIRCTPWPDSEGTVISGSPDRSRPGILGVAARTDQVLVMLDLEGTWQRVGVIADVASCFQGLNLSIDMLASSQTHVTVGLDPAANQLSSSVLDALCRELEDVGTPRIEHPTASVSLVGTSIADVLHELGPLLGEFEHEHVHLVSHAANDLSLTLLVDQEASGRLVPSIHKRLFGEREATDPDLGPTWDELHAKAETRGTGAL